MQVLSQQTASADLAGHGAARDGSSHEIGEKGARKPSRTRAGVDKGRHRLEAVVGRRCRHDGPSATFGPSARHELGRRGTPAMRSRGFSRQPQQRQRVLDMRGVEEFQAAEFDERDVAPRQLEFQRRAVMGGAKQHRLRFQAGPRLPVLEHARLRYSAPDRPPRRRSTRTGGAPPGRSLQRSFAKRSGAEADHRVGSGEDRPGGAIVAIERDDPRGRSNLGKSRMLRTVAARNE